mgnify:CR=1 FL=1
MDRTRRTLLLVTTLLAAFSCGKDDSPERPDITVPVKEEGTSSSGTGESGNDGNLSLGDLAALQGIKLGAAFTYGEYTGNKQIAEILTTEFKAVTFGNEMKHDAIVKTSGQMDFTTADKMAGWAEQAGTELFGHVLGWHSQQQKFWLDTVINQAKADSSTSPEEAVDAEFKRYVYAMVEHFDVYAWDVVNETFADGGNGAFRTAATTQAGDHVFVWGSYYSSTKEWVDRAFQYATEACKEYGKSPILYINDYNLETDAGKRKGLCDYAKGNPQVTGVATQMHIDMSTYNLKDKIKETLTALVATGKMVRIAELDIKATDLDAQAELYRYIFEQYLSIVPAEQRGGITFWGINDKDSWVGEYNHPLLWSGANYDKKPAYDAIYAYLSELAGN